MGEWRFSICGNESEMSSSGRVIPLEQATPGMVLSAAVRRSDGSVLLAEGCTLGESQLSRLRELGIQELAVSAPAGDASSKGSEDAVRAGVRRLFRKSEMDEVTQGFFKTVLEYRLETLK